MRNEKFENSIPNGVSNTANANTTCSNGGNVDAKTTIRQHLQKIIEDRAARVNTLVKERADYVVDTLRENIIHEVERAFVLTTIRDVTICIKLDPTSCLTQADTYSVDPNTPKHRECGSIWFVLPQYNDTEDEKLASGEVFNRKLASVLAKRLVEELEFTPVDEKKDEYQLVLNLSSQLVENAMSIN